MITLKVLKVAVGDYFLSTIGNLNCCGEPTSPRWGGVFLADNCLWTRYVIFMHKTTLRTLSFLSPFSVQSQNLPWPFWFWLPGCKRKNSILQMTNADKAIALPSSEWYIYWHIYSPACIYMIYQTYADLYISDCPEIQSSIFRSSPFTTLLIPMFATCSLATLVIDDRGLGGFGCQLLSFQLLLLMDVTTKLFFPSHI